MTFSAEENGEIFKGDTRGRVRVPRARREELLDEFERGGSSAGQFASYAGIKYPSDRLLARELAGTLPRRAWFIGANHDQQILSSPAALQTGTNLLESTSSLVATPKRGAGWS